MQHSINSHIILLGLGHVGFRVFQILRRLGEEVVVIDQGGDPERVARVEKLGGVFIAGDARNPAVLQASNPKEAKALLALTDQDLVNLSVAIDTHQLNPKAKIIVRLFDQELAKHIRQVFSIQTALSTSAIAAPLFTAGIVNDHNLACFQALGRSCAIVHWQLDGLSPYLGLPIGVFAELEACQPCLLQRDGKLFQDFRLDEPFRAGDRIMGIRREEKPRPKRRARTQLFRQVHEFFSHIPRVGRVLMMSVVLLLASGVPVFRYRLGLSWLDAAYFAITTLTTTGYGDINLLNAPDWVKVFGGLYMLAGAALLASLIGIVTDYLLSSRLRELLGLGASPLDGHVVLVGVGSLGQRIVEELEDMGKPVAVCGPNHTDERYLSAIRSRVRVVDGDPRNQTALIRAGAQKAQAIIAITEDDVFNLSVGLLAKQINPDIRTIVRVFDGYLAKKLKDKLRIDQVYSISAAAAPSFAAALYEPNPITGFVWGEYLAWVSHSDGPNGEADTMPLAAKITLSHMSGATADGFLCISLLPLDSNEPHVLND